MFSASLQHRKVISMSIMNIKNIRKTIFIPLIALAILSSALVLTFSVFLYSRDMSDSIHERLQLAVASAQQEIDAMIQITQIAASGLAESKGIAPGMAAGHETLEELSQQTLTGRMTISYSMSYDAEGKVLHRTYSSSHGEDYSHLPHVFAPINGQFFSGISQSPTVRLGITTSAPVYDYDDNLVGAVSFGFRLDTQDVARRLKELIGYDITFFLGDERVSTTIVDLEGNYVVGTRLDPAISAIVLAGESYTSKVAPLGREILVQYTPMKDFRGETVGIMLVGFYMEEYDAMVNYFITRGLLITLGIIFAAVIIAAYITTVVERRLKNSMESTNKALEEKNALAGLEKILNGLDTMIYVTNPRTSEIIFINENMREHFGIEGNPVGQICYKVFQKGMDKQCKFCPCRTLDKDPKKIIVWQEKNTLTGRNYRNTDRYIKLPNGMTVHLQHSIDTTEL
ncbi:MAG: cache domain-containing protein, partial [Defluviitaleaceae bacterium]|nr:cache domain-containing protein [Defluviitaleaceae bacterium]